MVLKIKIFKYVFKWIYLIQRYSKKFTRDYKKICENHIKEYNIKENEKGREGIKEIFGHPFKKKFKRQMIEKGIQSNFITQKISFKSGDRNNLEVHNVDNEFRLKIIDFSFDEFMKYKTRTISKTDVLDSIKDKFESDLWIYKMDTNKQKTIENYMSNLLNGVKHIIELPSSKSNRISERDLGRIIGSISLRRDIVNVWKHRINKGNE